MKSDESIKNITIAAIRRSSREMETWTRTKLINKFPVEIKSQDNELPVVYFKIDDENWTLITTKRIIGQFESSKREVFFEELDDTVWGLYKNTKIDKTVFRTSDMYGDQKDFYMETGYPSMAFVYGVQTIDRLTKSNII
jgi:hypothetical protein